MCGAGETWFLVSWLFILQSKEGNRGSKRGGDDDEPVRTPWEITRDQQMTKQVESHNVSGDMLVNFVIVMFSL